MQVCTSLQTDNHASTPPLSFYRLDAFSDAQPTVSKHWSHTNRSNQCMDCNINSKICCDRLLCLIQQTWSVISVFVTAKLDYFAPPCLLPMGATAPPPLVMLLTHSTIHTAFVLHCISEKRYDFYNLTLTTPNQKKNNFRNFLTDYQGNFLHDFPSHSKFVSTLPCNTWKLQLLPISVTVSFGTRKWRMFKIYVCGLCLWAKVNGRFFLRYSVVISYVTAQVLSEEWQSIYHTWSFAKILICKETVWI